LRNLFIMTTKSITHFKKQPSITVSYTKAVLNTIVKAITKSSSKKPFTQQYCVSGLSIDLNNFQQYINCCGFKHTGYLPATYPFVVAFPLLMKLMTSKAFPVSILGLIHYSNRITQHIPIKQNTTLTILCHVGHDHTSNKGRFIETHIDIFENGKLVWECSSTFLQSLKQKRPDIHFRQSKTTDSYHSALNKQEIKAISSLQFTALDALKYAYISKDANPIHLHHIPAKLMGFRTTMMHGMLAKARVLAQLEVLIDIQHISINVQFKNAIYLPTQVCLNVALSQQNNTFSLMDSEQCVTHLSGVILPLLNRMN